VKNKRVTFFIDMLLFCGLSGKCSAGEYECAVGNECVAASQLCDGVQHCSDGSDEDRRAECAMSSAAGTGHFARSISAFFAARCLMSSCGCLQCPTVICKDTIVCTSAELCDPCR